MEGTDVAMLEELLWQLGISPQARNPGAEGARIDSVRYINRTGTPVDTAPCISTQEEKRNTFLSYANPCAPDDAGVSTELMVKRFNARNLATVNLQTTAGVAPTRGNVNITTLGWLQRDWELYNQAYSELANFPVFNYESYPMTPWLEETVNLWEEGNDAQVPPTLTQVRYNGVLVLAGLAADSRNRADLLRSWVHEESPNHWGKNQKDYQNTPFRLSEGGADENGSLSYSQVLYRYRFGPVPCRVHEQAKENLYHPQGSLHTMVLHSASDSSANSDGTNCQGGIHKAFVNNNAGHPPLRYTYANGAAAAGQPMDDFVGYLDNRGALVQRALTEREDAYEALAKGIGDYNSPRPFRGRSWPRLLRYMRWEEGRHENTNALCHSCKYSLLVRNDPGVFEGNLRTYIWRGGTYPSFLPDGTPHPSAGQQWCLAYGEHEWISGVTFTSAFNQTNRIANGNPNEGDTSYVTACN